MTMVITMIIIQQFIKHFIWKVLRNVSFKDGPKKDNNSSSLKVLPRLILFKYFNKSSFNLNSSVYKTVPSNQNNYCCIHKISFTHHSISHVIKCDKDYALLFMNISLYL